MLHLFLRAERSLLIGCALGIGALVGWSGFAYSSWSSRHLAGQVGTLTAERDAAIAKHQRLTEAAGELSQVEAKLSATRVEYSRAVQAWAETKGRLGAAQQELAGLSKRLDQARDRVAQTGSLRQREAPKAPAPKP